MIYRILLIHSTPSLYHKITQLLSSNPDKRCQLTWYSKHSEQPMQLLQNNHYDLCLLNEDYLDIVKDNLTRTQNDLIPIILLTDNKTIHKSEIPKLLIPSNATLTSPHLPRRELN